MSLMKIPFIGVILASFYTVLMLSGCGGSVNSNNSPEPNRANASASTKAAKSNVEELSMLVRVPYEAEDIVWEQDPSTRNIVAVFRFSPEDAKKLVAEAEGSGPGKPVSIPVETWYPDELIAQGEMSGDSTLKGTAYSANAFFQEPYKTGRITRVEDVDYFVLEVSPK
jgi:hypothetical protein